MTEGIEMENENCSLDVLSALLSFMANAHGVKLVNMATETKTDNAGPEWPPSEEVVGGEITLAWGSKLRSVDDGVLGIRNFAPGQRVVNRSKDTCLSGFKLRIPEWNHILVFYLGNGHRLYIDTRCKKVVASYAQSFVEDWDLWEAN